MTQKYDWINYEIMLRDLEEKIRFISQFEKWVREWKQAESVDSFHFKIYHDQRCARIRLLPIGDRHESLIEELRNKLREFGGEDILGRSSEVLHDKENVGWIDHVTCKILECSTEILFVLVDNYGRDYIQKVKEKYWTRDFDMIHLLLNQLGPDERDNLLELYSLFSSQLFVVLSMFCGIKLEPAK